MIPPKEKKNGIVKVTTSGQVTLPKKYRDKFDTDLFLYEIEGNTFVVRPLQIMHVQDAKKYRNKDIDRFTFSSKNKKEKNLARKIDSYLYGSD